MSPNLTAALIAGGVSLATALITYFSTKWKTQKDLEGAFASRLQQLRLDHYPKAFEITERLGKRGNWSMEDASTMWLNLIVELRIWKSGIPALIMSNQTLSAYYAINEAMKASFAKGSHFGEQQIDRIIISRDKFRKALRKDIGV
jgi:hypothetical protein